MRPHWGVKGHLAEEWLLLAGFGALSMPKGSYLHRGALPETPGSPGAREWGRALTEGGSPRWRGRGTGRCAALTMRVSPRLGARGPGPPGWPGLGVGDAPGGRRPPRHGFAGAATCLHRDQLLPPLRREGEGAGLWSRSLWPIGAQHANEGARHTAASAGLGCPSPCSGSGWPGNAAAARNPTSQIRGPSYVAPLPGPRGPSSGKDLRYVTWPWG